MIFLNDERQSVYPIHKAESKRTDIEEIKERDEEDMTMSQELGGTQSLSQEPSVKRQFTKGGSDSDYEGSAKKVMFREDHSDSMVSKGDYFMVIDPQQQEMNQKFFEGGNCDKVL